MMMTEQACWAFLDSEKQAQFVRRRCIRECDAMKIETRINILLSNIQTNKVVARLFKKFVEEKTDERQDNKNSGKTDMDENQNIPNKNEID